MWVEGVQCCKTTRKNHHLPDKDHLGGNQPCFGLLIGEMSEVPPIARWKGQVDW